MSEGYRPITQRIIADEAGVSQATVSLVLAGRNVSSDDTRQRVLRAAERLKYRPNLLVHGIQTGKTRMIGVMMPPFDSFWSDVLYGIHDVLTAADHVPITLWTSHDSPRRNRSLTSEGRELEQIHRLLDRRVDGVILWPPFASLFSDHVHEFSSRELPVVTIDHQLPPEFNADCVASDETLGGRLIAAHLLALGHRRIGHLAGQSVATWAVERRRAFEDEVHRHGGTCVTVESPPGEDASLALPQARQLVGLADRPTAIFAASDPLAKQVYRAAADAGLRIPQDLSVVGFADDDFAVDLNPPLTTVRQTGYEIGRVAAELALARITGGYRENAARLERLPVSLIVRGSTSAAAE